MSFLPPFLFSQSKEHIQKRRVSNFKENRRSRFGDLVDQRAQNMGKPGVTVREMDGNDDVRLVALAINPSTRDRLANT